MAEKQTVKGKVTWQQPSGSQIELNAMWGQANVTLWWPYSIPKGTEVTVTVSFK